MKACFAFTHFQRLGSVMKIILAEAEAGGAAPGWVVDELIRKGKETSLAFWKRSDGSSLI